MFFDFMQQLIADYQNWGYAFLLLVSFLESLAIVGLIIPGTTLTVIFGLMAADGDFKLAPLITVCAVGAVLGDGVSYLLGRKGTSFTWRGKELLSKENLGMGHEFFEKHGNKSVFFGRFIGPLRPLVPFIAGVLRMKPEIFYFWNIFSAVIWAVTFVLVGYFFGNAWKIFGAWYGRIGAVLVVCITIVLIVGVRRLKKEFVKRHELKQGD